MEAEHSAQAIQAQLEQIKEQQAALEHALEVQLKEERKTFVDELRQQILDRGYDPDQIAELIGKGKRKRRANGSDSSNSGYTRYADPDDPERVYIRGRMPNWMSEKMTAHGFDPDNAEHRQQFKDEHLVKVAA